MYALYVTHSANMLLTKFSRPILQILNPTKITGVRIYASLHDLTIDF